LTTPAPENLRILAADIGGTNARFAAVLVDRLLGTGLSPVFSMDTRQQGIGSFKSFWKAFLSQAPDELADTDAFDAVALALAGSVSAHTAVLPNIDWDIRPSDAFGFHHLYLLNDFVAQGYALAAGDALDPLETVREGKPELQGVRVLVGAGTGLGHCALFPTGEVGHSGVPFRVAGSEAGHCTFSFQGEREREIESRWLKRTGKTWLSNDDVVSGPGLVNLHASITGQDLPAAAAVRHGETAALFSRFYARACRNYCLSVFPVSVLVLSGGIAARNPQLVRSENFLETFNDGRSYAELLKAIPVRLNSDDHIGIRGAAVHAAIELRRGS